MKYSCDLIRDLLPLYCDKVCSEDSAEAVREHISACVGCRELCERMQQRIPLEVSMGSAGYERQQLASMREVESKIKKRNTLFGTIGIIVGILLVVAVVRVLLVVGVIVFAVQDGQKDSHVSTDIGEYGKFEGFRGYSKLDVFPGQIGGNMEVNDYYYYYADTFLDPTAQIYLECSYEKDSYLEELGRLEGIREEYKGKVQTVVYDTESFPYPAYVTIDAYNQCHEYALLLGEGRIAYVFLQFIKEDEIAFPAEYLPEGYGQREEGYSIYVFRQENGDGYCVY